VLPAAALLAGLWLAGCGGGSGTPEAAPRNESAIAPASAAEVVGYVRGRLQARGPQGGAVFDVAGGPAWLATATTTTGVVTRTGTLVQEAGVDEDDLLKTDGQRLYTLQPMTQEGKAGAPFARLAIYNRDGAGRPTFEAEALLDGGDSSWTSTRGMLLAPEAKRVAVLAEAASFGLDFPDCPPGTACIAALLPYRPLAAQLHVQLLDVSRPQALPRPERLLIDGRLVGSRLIGNTLFLVAVHTPSLAFDRLPPDATDAQRKAALDALTLADLMPRISVNGGASQPLVDSGECWLQPANPSTQVSITTLTTIDLGAPGNPRISRCFVGGTEALYMSPQAIYLATTRNEVQTLQGRPFFVPEMRTDIHKFGVAGGRIDYRGSGSVNGSLGWDRERTPYRMSEHDGDLRVVSFTGSTGWISAADAGSVAPSPATLTVLRERSSDASLQVVATLPNSRRPEPIGKAGEQVYAVRFLGPQAYVVTFRRTDPLYVLDLTDPADPKRAGELQVPGFSDWLFPLDGGLLFGVGKDASADGRVQGVKVALFDVRDAANPRLLDSRNYGAPGSSSALDYSAHGLSLQVVDGVTRLALPLQLLPAGQGFVQQQLQRFEVDRTARSLRALAPIELGNGWADLASVRSLQLGEQLYHLRDGKLLSWDW
jgi:hypothetical protein